MSGDADANGTLSAAEEAKLLKADALQQKREVEARQRAEADAAAKADAAAMDAVIDATRKQQLLKDQAALAAAEAEVRTDEELSKQEAASRLEALRDDYASDPDHSVYVDYDGTVLALGYTALETANETHDAPKPKPGDDAAGAFTLERVERAPATEEVPASTQTTRVVLAADGSSVDQVIVASVGTGTPNEVLQSYTETVSADPAGVVTASQVEDASTRTNDDGSTDRTSSIARFDAAGVLTDSREESRSEDATGTTTQASVDASTFAADGTTPTSRTIHTTALGQPDVATEVSYDADGIPSSTYIERAGEVPSALPDREYVTWNGDGTPDQRVAWYADAAAADYAEQDKKSLDDGTARVDSDPVAMSYNANSVHEDHLADAAADEQLAKDRSAPTAAELAKMARGGADVVGAKLLAGDTVAGTRPPMAYTRADDNLFEGSKRPSELVPPLAARSSVAALRVPEAIAARAVAAQLDAAAPKPGTPAFDAVLAEQAAYEAKLAAAAPEARVDVMAEYFTATDIWIDAGVAAGDAPVVLAATWSTGETLTGFGADLASTPHVVLARSGIAGVDEAGAAAQFGVVSRVYPDGTTDDLVESTSGTGASTTSSQTAERSTAAGVVTNREQHSTSTTGQFELGLAPLAVTTSSIEQFDPITGKPVGEQYQATATSDSATTSLQERTDTYGADGVIDDTKIASNSTTRTWNGEAVDGFVAANAAVLAQARQGTDAFDINSDGTSITVPPVGSWSSTSLIDIDYDPSGTATYQSTQESLDRVESSGPTADDVQVTRTETTREMGARGGTAPIFTAEGARLTDEVIVTNTSISGFDPNAGSAGGDTDQAHQLRSSSSITTGGTLHTDGTTSDQWASPLTTAILNEGYDDDWVFEEHQYKTKVDGSLELDGEGDAAKPVDVSDSTTIKVENLDFGDHFESFMEGAGGIAVGVGSAVLGIAGAALTFTGVGAVVGIPLMIGAAALGTVSLTKTVMDYSQGEAELWQVGLDAVGVAAAFTGVLKGAQLVAKAGTSASAASTALRGGAGARAVTSNPMNAVITGTQGLDAGATVLGGGIAVGQGITTGNWTNAGILAGTLVGGGGAAAGMRAAARRAAPAPDVALAAPAAPPMLAIEAPTPMLAIEAGRAGVASLTSTPSPTTSPFSQKLIPGGPQMLDAATGLIAQAKSSIRGDVFIATGRIPGALRDASARGVDVRLILDPSSASRKKSIEDVGATTTNYSTTASDDRMLAEIKKRYGSDPAVMQALADSPERLVELMRLGSKRWTAANLDELNRLGFASVDKPTVQRTKVHSKWLSIDGERGLLTGAFMDGSGRRKELSFAIEDPTIVQALDAWHVATEAGDVKAMRSTAAQLGERGIFVNDPAAGAKQRALTAELIAMIDRVPDGGAIHIVSKMMDQDSSVAAALRTAQASRGITVTSQPNTLKDIHANVMITPDEVYVGTAHLTKPALDGSKHGRQSRELGIVTSDPAVGADVRAWSDELAARAAARRPMPVDIAARRQAALDAQARAAAARQQAARELLEHDPPAANVAVEQVRADAARVAAWLAAPENAEFAAKYGAVWQQRIAGANGDRFAALMEARNLAMIIRAKKIV